MQDRPPAPAWAVARFSARSSGPERVASASQFIKAQRFATSKMSRWRTPGTPLVALASRPEGRGDLGQWSGSSAAPASRFVPRGGGGQEARRFWGGSANFRSRKC